MVDSVSLVRDISNKPNVATNLHQNLAWRANAKHQQIQQRPRLNDYLVQCSGEEEPLNQWHSVGRLQRSKYWLHDVKMHLGAIRDLTHQFALGVPNQVNATHAVKFTQRYAMIEHAWRTSNIAKNNNRH
jgi:hypothetical protein